VVEWTIDDVAARFEEAAETARRLPPVLIQGYFSTWPAFVLREWEGFAADEKVYKPLPPSPQAIDRMLETMRWVQWLPVDLRHIVWMRTKGCRWREIAARGACCTKTARRRWIQALERIATRLNADAIERAVSNIERY